MSIAFYQEITKSVEFKVSPFGIKVKKHHSEVELIGVGRSACAFLIKGTNKVIKIFPSEFTNIAKLEAKIYRRLKGIPQFPTIYDSGYNYIVMEYIQGHTLFDCLHKGIEIKEEQILEVDKILDSARERGLNPSDVHLKNIILTRKGIKLIDVARFEQNIQCFQWRDLKTSYFKVYKKKFFPKRLPKLLINIISKIYKLCIPHQFKNV